MRADQWAGLSTGEILTAECAIEYLGIEIRNNCFHNEEDTNAIAKTLAASIKDIASASHL